MTVVTDEKIMKVNIVGVFQRYGKSWEKAQADGCRVFESEGMQSAIGGVYGYISSGRAFYVRLGCKPDQEINLFFRTKTVTSR